MRSEERAGVIAAILLFTWGTLVTEPLHIFTEFIFDVLMTAGHKLGMASGGRMIMITATVAMAVISLLLMLISKTEIGDYIPCAVMFIIVTAFVTKAVVFKSYSVKQAIAVAVTLAVIGVLYICKLQRVMLWATDVFIMSIGMYIITGFVFIPIAGINKITGRIFYIARYQHADLSAPFDGFIHIPAIAWGVFFAVLLVLPTAYYAFSRRKG